MSIQHKRYEKRERAIVTLDKDVKRRCSMEKDGYLYRLHKGFLDDEKYYRLMNNMTRDDIVEKRFRLFRKTMPAYMWRNKNKSLRISLCQRPITYIKQNA